MAKFMLFIRGGYEVTSQFSPEEMQAVIGRYRQWAGALSQAGRLVEAEKLCDDGGRLLRRTESGFSVDGPFTETKETIGGYYIIHAGDYDEALELAKECPIFDEGGDVELRKIEGS